MEPLDVLFALIERFIPVDKSQFITMRNKATDWRALAQKGEAGQIGRLYMKVISFWGLTMAITLSYIPLCNYIQRRQAPQFEDLDTDEM